MAGGWNHLEPRSLTCLAIGLKGLKSWAQLGLLMGPPTGSPFMWIGLPHSMAASIARLLTAWSSKSECSS